ncbi:MAG: CPBP family intramembrane glutamic endopeptidase [Myxococcota bacterium]
MEQPVEPARDSGPTETNFVRLGLLFYAALAAAGGVWRIGFYDEPILFTSVAAQAEELSLGRDLLIGVAAAAALIALSDWATLKTRWGDDLARAMARALGPLSVSNAVLLALVSGFAEEVFFRGALQPRVGWLLASLLFGCVHFVPRREFLPWTGFAIGAGLLFGALFVWTGNLLAPVTAHVVVNGVNLPRLVRRYGPAEPT